MSAPIDPTLRQLAEQAGLLTSWRDVHGRDHKVHAETLRSVLEAMDIPCSTPEQCSESLARLGQEASADTGRLLVVKSGALIIVRRAGSPHYRIQLEDGSRIMGTARDLDGGTVAIPGIRRPGYHRLEMGRVNTVIAVIPQRSPSAAEITGHPRSWVLSAQVYSLRRSGDGAIGSPDGVVAPGWEIGGDFSAVGRLARHAAAEGAAGMAISPVHALFTADPDRYSPYSPSSRLFLNAMYVDPAGLFDADDLAPLMEQEGVAMTDTSACMDWPAIQMRRRAQLRRLFEAFRHKRPERLLRDFEAFCRQGGDALHGHACYEALHAHHVPELGPGHGWRDWASEYRDPAGVAVQRFAQAHEVEVEFHAFLQWLAARGLADAHAAGCAAGMPIGLITDMAIGTDPRGSDAWCRQTQIMTGVSVGAPPDLFQPGGQDWGLTAFSPRALQLCGYEGYIATLRAALAHSGGIRVDHVLGLGRMWLVPEGARAADGVYLRYPRDEMMDVLSLEAWRHQAVVIGEDLGTVPEDFSAALEQRGFLGMNVLWFQQESSDPPAFIPREAWRSRAMAMVSTHDLPTLRGWWQAQDVHWRERLGQLTTEEAEAQRLQRERERQALWAALQNAGLLALDAPVSEDAPVAEVIAYVAGSPATLCSIALEDLLGQLDQPNLPASGSGDAQEGGHPNWCRVLNVSVDEVLQAGDVPALLRLVRQARGDNETSGAAE